ncbi:MAG: glutamine amidotransferase [Sulfurimonas sp.]|jgi:glutamine amidotransferase|uniref:imidazole glycerol phosphate synthase subunit HisH n=1 Tax=Sulfurimonas sp. TaxID=2022749 RepID=UPI0039E5AF4C
MLVDIIDIGSGNIKSIQNLIEHLNVQTNIVRKTSDLKSNLIILPGVGSAGSYMKRLKEKEFDKAILHHINNNGRLLGICLGFQILGHYSEEDNGVEGLGILNSHTKKLLNSTHNGWENFDFKTNEMKNQSFNSQLKLTRKKNIRGRVFYNHEYAVVNHEEKAYTKTISDQYNQYSSITIKENIIGLQFHPEKSQQTGLNLISMIL